MTTIQIKSRFNNAVLFECEAPEELDSGLRVRHALEKAVLSGASLVGASLDGGEKLSSNRPVFSIGPIGSREDMFMAFTTDQGLRLKTGCFFGDIEQFRENLLKEHGTNAHRDEYEAALLLIEKHAALWPAS